MYRSVERSLEQRVRNTLEKWRPRYDSPANDSILIDEAKARDFENTYASTGLMAGSLSELADELFDKGKIIYAPTVREALDQAKNTGDNVQYNFNSVALEQRVLDVAEQSKFDITNVTDLADAMSYLISENEVSRSAFGQQRQFEVSQEKQRQDLIARITLGRDSFPLPTTAQTIFLNGVNHGKAIPVDSRRIQGESLERLKELEAHVAAYRQARAGGRLEKPTAQTDSLGELSSRSERITNNAPQVRVMHPTENREITRDELFYLAKHDVAAFRKVAFPQNATPEQKKQVAARVNEILGAK